MSQRIEVQHNTPEQVREYVSDAIDLVDAIEPPDDLRAAVFTEAVRLLSSKTVQVMQAAPTLLPSMAIPHGKGH